MPNPLNRITGDQWDICARCGRPFPLGELLSQKGLKVCSRDFDNTLVEQREEMINQLLSSDAVEGADQRDEIAFFAEEI